MRKLENSRRILILVFTALSIIGQIAGYGICWFKYYKSIIPLIFYIKGDILMISIYAVMLYCFTKMYGGTKIGQLKASDVFFSQTFATVCANVVIYAVVCLMSAKLVVPKYMLIITGFDIVWIAIWAVVSQWFHRMLFPPRDMLLVSGDSDTTDDIIKKFATRPDKYKICKTMNINEGIDAICKEVMERYDAIVLWDIPLAERNKILKFCYGNFIRVYIMPKIPDVIVRGMTELHVFDTPIYLSREYALKLEQKITKRVVDVVCSLILFVIASPFMLITAILIKCYDGGPVFYKQTRCTVGGREFSILKFRSMKVDAEKDGVARLASKGDDRITPVGKFIRATRIDELPQLLNILAGDMSFVGPRPERPEIIKQYLEDMPEFAYRLKVKAGLCGYAQLYGKYNTTPLDKLKLDLTYIENYSVWLDFKIMFLTARIVIKPESTEGVDTKQTTALKK